MFGPWQFRGARVVRAVFTKLAARLQGASRPEIGGGGAAVAFPYRCKGDRDVPLTWLCQQRRATSDEADEFCLSKVDSEFSKCLCQLGFVAQLAFCIILYPILSPNPKP